MKQLFLLDQLLALENRPFEQLSVGSVPAASITGSFADFVSFLCRLGCGQGRDNSERGAEVRGAELLHVQAGGSGSGAARREAHPFSSNCRHTLVQKTRGLLLTYAPVHHSHGPASINTG